MDDTGGLGPQVGFAYNLYTSGVSGHRLGYWPVIFPAYSTDLLFTGHVRQYFAGLDQGVDDVVALLKARATTCPQEHYVLAGYSQGAMLIHRVLWEIADGRVPLTVDRIDGVIAVADGDRQFMQGGHLLGTAADSIGISLISTKLSSVRYKAQRRSVPAGVADRFHSICDASDVVCDPVEAGVSVVAGVGFAAVHLLRGVRVHTRHYLPGKAGAAAVTSAASATARVTAARPPVPALAIVADLPPGLLGHPYSAQFSATGGASPYTFWSNELPTGLTLAPDGHLTGSFSSAPPLSFKVRVTDSNGQVRWQTVTIQNDNYTIGDCGYWVDAGESLTITAGDWITWGGNDGHGPIVDTDLDSYSGTIFFGDGASEPIALGGGPYAHTYNVAGSYNARIVADGSLAVNGHRCHDEEPYSVVVLARPPSLWPETTGSVTHTWTNYTNAGGTQGPTIAAYQTVQIACKLQGWVAPDGNNWWYRIASSPWNGTYYASADAFYNNGATSGSLHGTPFVDNAVANC